MKVPERLGRKRVVVDFEAPRVQRIPKHAQVGAVTSNERGYRRLTGGRPMPHRDVADPPAPKETPFVNVPGTVEGDSYAGLTDEQAALQYATTLEHEAASARDSA